MAMAEAFADWGGDSRRKDPTPVPARKTARLKSVAPAVGKNNELVLEVHIEFTEEDVGA
jgi:hypothetical protein